MLRFLWAATRGFRLQPWKSPYLRWRIETYTGKPAETIDAAAFWRFLWVEQKSLWAYLLWIKRFQTR
jgi:hypothetical protein